MPGWQFLGLYVLCTFSVSVLCTNKNNFETIFKSQNGNMNRGDSVVERKEGQKRSDFRIRIR